MFLMTNFLPGGNLMDESNELLRLVQDSLITIINEKFYTFIQKYAGIERFEQ